MKKSAKFAFSILVIALAQFSYSASASATGGWFNNRPVKCSYPRQTVQFLIQKNSTIASLIEFYYERGPIAIMAGEISSENVFFGFCYTQNCNGSMDKMKKATRAFVTVDDEGILKIDVRNGDTTDDTRINLYIKGFGSSGNLIEYGVSSVLGMCMTTSLNN
ncbi:MAG: hypothetical protein J0M15_14025 [Deltaproteobacteria bacterium]|nr:hypothetical protein [Deltaproteobacteria bacterium]